jgi:phage portal protein BeeE
MELLVLLAGDDNLRKFQQMLNQFLSRFAARAHSRAPETKSAPPLIALQLLGQPNWSARDYRSLATKAVMGNAIVYRCVRMIAEGAASVPFLVYDGAEKVSEHPLRALLDKPNVHESGTALFERWYASCNAPAMRICRRRWLAVRYASFTRCVLTASR